jgi:hypothetical protein
LAAYSGTKNMISSTFWKKTRLTAHSGKKHEWHHILGKKHDWHHILGKNMIGSTFWGKNMNGSTFWVKKHD